LKGLAEQPFRAGWAREVGQAYYSLVTNTLDKNNLSILGKMYLDRIYNRTVKSTNVNVT